MTQPTYQVDETQKTLLTALQKCGRHKTFAEILVGNELSNEKQDELANTLEAMGLIESISFKLPFEIRAELSMAGELFVDSFRKPEKRKPAPVLEKPSSRKSKAKAALEIEDDL